MITFHLHGATFQTAVVSKKMFHLQGQKGQDSLCVARVEGTADPHEPSSPPKRQEKAQMGEACMFDIHQIWASDFISQ